MTMTRKGLLLAATAVVTAVGTAMGPLSTPAEAATLTWSKDLLLGNGWTESAFTPPFGPTATNWRSNDVLDGNDRIVFSDSYSNSGSGLTSNNDSAFINIDRILFEENRNTTTIGGSLFDLVGDGSSENIAIRNKSQDVMIINAPIRLLNSVGFDGQFVDYSFFVNGQPRVADGGTVIINGAISESGSNGITVRDGGVELNGANTFSGGVTVIDSQVKIGQDTSLGTGALTLNNSTLQANSSMTISNTTTLSGGQTSFLGLLFDTNAKISVTSGNELTHNGTIQGETLEKRGGGVLTLSGTNTYTDDTIIDEGTLRMGQPNVLPSSMAVKISSGATFDLNSRSQTIAALEDWNGAGAVTLGNGSLTVSNGNFGGDISGDGILNKVGSGTLTLRGENTNFRTDILSGTISLDDDEVLGDASTVTFIGGNGTLRLNGHTETINRLRSLTPTGRVDLGSGGSLTVLGDYSGSVDYDGIITGDGSFTKDGTGNLRLGGTSDYTGDTSILDGDLVFDGAGTGSGASGVRLGENGRLHVIGDNTVRFLHSVTPSASAGGRVDLAGDLTINSTIDSASFYGVITGSGRALIKEGTGRQRLFGANTYSGGTTINGGSIEISSDANLGASSGTLTLNNGGQLRTFGNISDGPGGSGAMNRVITLAGDSTIRVNGPSSILEQKGNIIGTSTLTVDGTGTFIMAGADNSGFTGDIDISNGIFVVGSGTSFTNGATITSSGALRNDGSLDNTGDLSTSLNLSNNAGGTLDNSGSIVVDPSLSGQSSAFLDNRGTLNNQSGGSIDVKDDAELANFSTGVLNNQAGATIDIRAGGTFNNFTGGTLNNDGTFRNSGFLSSDAAINNSGALANQAGGTILNTNDINSTGTFDNAGLLRNFDTATFEAGSTTTNQTGGTIENRNALDNRGDMTLESGSVIENNESASLLRNFSTGTITMESGSLVENSRSLNNSGALEVQAGATLDNAGGTINNNGTTTFRDGAVFDNTGGIVNNDIGGTLAIEGAIANAGTMRIDDGSTLAIDGGTLNNNGTILNDGGFDNLGTFANSGLYEHRANADASIGGSIVNTGTFDGGGGVTLTGDISGSGTFQGSVTMGGTFGPGNSPGLVTAETLMFGSSSTLFMEVGGLTRGTEYDAIDAFNVTLGGLLDVALIDLANDFSPMGGETFDLIIADQISGSFSSFAFAALADGLSWATNLFTNQFGQQVYQLMVEGQLTGETGVPTPGALILLAFGLVGIGISRKKRQQRAT